MGSTRGRPGSVRLSPAPPPTLVVSRWTSGRWALHPCRAAWRTSPSTCARPPAAAALRDGVDATTLSPATRGRRGGRPRGWRPGSPEAPGEGGPGAVALFPGVAQEPGGRGTARAGSARTPAESEPKAKGAGPPLPRDAFSGGRHAPPSRRTAAW